MVSTLTILALASGALALQVTSPSKSSVWTVGDSETVTWDSVSSDQDTFNIYLSNMASYPTTTILLASDVSSSAGSAKIDGSKLAAGNAFTINFTNGTETEQIYAQSNQFNITEPTSSSSSSAASSGSSSTASSSQTASSSTLSTATITSSSASSSSSSSSSSATTENASSTASTTGKSSSSASSTATGTSSESSAKSTGSATGSSAASTSTAATAGAGKIAAGWMGLAAVAALAL